MAISKSYWNEKYDTIIGSSYATLSKQGIKKFLFQLVKKCGLDNCVRCGQKIESSSELSIEHSIPYGRIEDPVEKEKAFYDIKSIKFSHLLCNCSHRNAFIGDNEYTGVQRYTVASSNEKFRCCMSIDGKSFKFGNFRKVEEAAIVHDLCIMKYKNGKGALNYENDRQKYKDVIKNGWSNDYMDKKLSNINKLLIKPQTV